MPRHEVPQIISLAAVANFRPHNGALVVLARMVSAPFQPAADYQTDNEGGERRHCHVCLGVCIQCMEYVASCSSCLRGSGAIMAVSSPRGSQTKVCLSV